LVDVPEEVQLARLNNKCPTLKPRLQVVTSISIVVATLPIRISWEFTHGENAVLVIAVLMNFHHDIVGKQHRDLVLRTGNLYLFREFTFDRRPPWI
jgi:hypothetical protein